MTSSSSLESLDASLSKLREELHQLRVENKRTCLNNCSSRGRTTKQLAVMSRRIKTIRGERMAKRSSLAPFLQIIKSVMTDRPQYVQALEAKVCQALHFMAIGNDQFVRFENDCDQHLSTLKSESISITNETTALSLNLMNQLSKIDDSSHGLRTAYLRVLQIQCAILRWLDSQVRTTCSHNEKEMASECSTVVVVVTPEKEDNQSSISSELDDNNMTPSKKLPFEKSFVGSESNGIFNSPVSVVHRTVIDDNDWPLGCEILSSESPQGQ